MNCFVIRRQPAGMNDAVNYVVYADRASSGCETP